MSKEEKSIKTGLVMEGGGLRSLFTCGVIDVFMEEGITFDGAIGVSAGAGFGINLKSRQHGRALKYNLEYAGDKRYMSYSNWIKKGDLFPVDFVYNEVPLKYYPFDFDAFKENPMDFYIVATDINKGKALYHKYTGWEDHGFEWIRASCSMPLAAGIVTIGTRQLLDGGITDSIPLRFFEHAGYGKNVVILTQPKDYVKKKMSAMPLISLRYRKYPELIKACARRHLMYNKETAYICEKEKRGEVFVIRPNEILPAGRTEKDPAKLQATYDEGRAAVLSRLEELKSFLAGKQ